MGYYGAWFFPDPGNLHAQQPLLHREIFSFIPNVSLGELFLVISYDYRMYNCFIVVSQSQTRNTFFHIVFRYFLLHKL